MIWMAAVCSGYPLVSSMLVKILGFKGYLPLPLSPTPRSKRELGHPLLSRERAKLRGRGKTENWNSPLNYFSLCAFNLFNTRVSQFELNYWNKWTFPRHIYIYIYIYIYMKSSFPKCDKRQKNKNMSSSCHFAVYWTYSMLHQCFMPNH